MLAVTRVDEMALSRGPLTVMEEDVVSRLRHLQRTLQECTRKVNRVDLALQTRNPQLQPRYDGGTHQNYVDATRVKGDQQDTEGVHVEGRKEDSRITREEYLKEDIEEARTEVTRDVIVTGRSEFYETLSDNNGSEKVSEEVAAPSVYPEVFAEEEDHEVCMQPRKKGKKKGDIKEQRTSTTLAPQNISDEEDTAGSEQSNDTQRPPLKRHAKIEIDSTEYAKTITIDPPTLDMDSYPMSTDLSPHTDTKLHHDTSDTNVDTQTLIEQEETQHEVAVEFADAKENITGSWEESGNESSDRGDPWTELISTEQTNTHGKQPHPTDSLRIVFDEQDIPLENTPETPCIHPGQRQTSSRTEKRSEKQEDSSVYGRLSLSSPNPAALDEATDRQSVSSDSQGLCRNEARPLPLCESQRIFFIRSSSKKGSQSAIQPFTRKDESQHRVQESRECEEEEWKYYDSCSYPNVSHPLQAENYRVSETEELCRTSSLKPHQLIDGKGSVEDDEVVPKSSKGLDDVTAARRMCDSCKVHSRTLQHQEIYQEKLRQQEISQQELSQQRFSQDTRSSLASLVVVFLLLCLLLFLGCCLMLVVPVVTVSVRTYGGSPTF